MTPHVPDQAQEARMAEEPGGWELRRALTEHREDMRAQFASLNERLDQMVSQGAYQADQRRLEDIIKNLADDLAVERVARTEAIALEREQRTTELNKEVQRREEADKANGDLIASMRATQRWIAAAIVLPIALFLATYLLGRGA